MILKAGYHQISGVAENRISGNFGIVLTLNEFFWENIFYRYALTLFSVRNKRTLRFSSGAADKRGAQCHPTSCQLVRASKLGGGPYKDPQYYRGESTHANSENSEGRRLLYACA